MSTFEEILKKDGRLVYKTMGVSMLPMLYQNRDIVVIVPPEGRLKKYDVALYKRGSSYIFHRIIGIQNEGYQIYCRFWNAIYSLRELLFRMRRIAGEIARMLGLRR